MKRSVIILLVLIAFFAIPALASTPQPENAPAPTSEDTMFLGWQLLSNEELIKIIGDRTILQNWTGNDVVYHNTDNYDVVIITVGQYEFILLDYNNDGSIDQFDLVGWSLEHPEYNLSVSDLATLGALLFGWNFYADRPLSKSERIKFIQIWGNPEDLIGIMIPN